MRHRAWLVAIVLVLVVTSLLPLTAYFPAAAQEATPAANGSLAEDDFAGLVNIGDRSLYLECTGSGSPTILLEAGNDDGVDGWALRGDLAAATSLRRRPRVSAPTIALTSAAATPCHFLVLAPTWSLTCTRCLIPRMFPVLTSSSVPRWAGSLRASTP